VVAAAAGCAGQLRFCATNEPSEAHAQIYSERWRIEVFFRYLKQNLRIKTSAGTSANALHIQIWTTLIAMLLLNTCNCGLATAGPCRIWSRGCVNSSMFTAICKPGWIRPH
jgi:hypothetical protein